MALSPHRERETIPITQEAGVGPRTSVDGCGKSRLYRDFFLFLFSVFYLFFFVLTVLALPLVLYCTTHTTQISMPLA